MTRLPGIDFAEDPLPHFRALQAQAGGRCLSAAYAGGTGNVEMELLTGIPSAFPGASREPYHPQRPECIPPDALAGEGTRGSGL